MFSSLIKKIKQTGLFYNIFFIFAAALLAAAIGFSLFVLALPQLESLQDKNLINAKVFFILRYYVSPFIPLIIAFVLLTRIIKKYNFITKTFWFGYQNNNFKWAIIGLGFGFAANGLGVLVAVLNKNISLVFASENFLLILLASAAVLIQSFTEEMMFRGFLFQAIAKAHKPWLGIILPALIFSAAHFFNPGISTFGKINIFLIGAVFGLGAYYFKSFWWAVTFHAAWNFTQNFIFGLPNSGVFSQISVFKLKNSTDSLFYSTSFGIEQSVTALAVEILLIAAIPLIASRQKKRIIIEEKKKN